MHNTETLSGRISVLVDLAGSASKLARSCGVSEGVIRKWKAGGSEPSTSHLIALCKASNTRLEWLATGEGPMRSGEPDPDIGAQFAMIAHYDVEASAGPGSVVEREPEIGKLAFRKAWIERKGLSAKDLMAIRIKGDSMTPTIRDASIVLVDGSKHDFNDDGIYVLQYDGHLVAKRLQRDALSGGVLIKSDNQVYETQQISRQKLDDLFIIGRVVWVGQEV